MLTILTGPLNQIVEVLKLESMNDNGLVTLNDGNNTRIKLYRGSMQRTSPDITIASSDISFKFNWQITNETLGSDHMIINVSSALHFSRQLFKKRNLKCANWVEYEKILDGLCSDFHYSDNLQQDYDSFINMINKVADKAIPFIKYCSDPTSKFVPKSFWTIELSHSVAKRRLALAVFRGNPTPSTLQKLNECIKQSRKLIWDASDKNWHTFCDSMNKKSSPSEIWNKMKWYKGYKSQYTPVDP